MFGTFSPRAIATPEVSQVLLAIQVESKEAIDTLVSKALASGGTRYREPTDHGWMYYDTFADLDGHQWEVMYAQEGTSGA